VVQNWQAKWYADTHYAESLFEDLKLRQAIQSKYADASISLVEIDRQAKEVTVTIYTARPGIVIGRGGQRVDELSTYLEELIGKKVRLNIQEIRQPELDANLVAKTIAEQIQRRIAYRRAMKQAIFRTMQAGAKGIRISCSGRLGDAEIARRQTMHEGQVPLHTLRADIDYGFTEARTTLGRIGVKVWIFKGEILPEPKEMAIEGAPAEAAVSAESAVEEPSVAEPEAIEEETTEMTGEATKEMTPEEAPVEMEAEATTDAVAEEKAAAAPSKPVRRRKAAAAKEEKPAEAPAAEAIEKTAEEKPAAKRRSRAAKPAETTKAAAAKTTKAAAEDKSKEKTAKPTTKRTRKTKATSEPVAEAELADITEDEDKDAATETG
jgi:small subunit ribosomal protein S3